MPSIHEIATVTSKGQITLPNSIRQALGIDVGGKVAFEMRGGQVIVTRAEATPHENPAIAGFLHLLEQDIQADRRITHLPEDLVRKMMVSLEQSVDPNAEIEDDVEL